MTEEKPLYQDARLRIDYHPNSVDDHLVFLNGCANEMKYLIPSRILEELAITPAGDISEIIDRFSPQLLFELGSKGISIDQFHIAVCQAYIEEEKRVKQFVREIME